MNDTIAKTGIANTGTREDEMNSIAERLTAAAAQLERSIVGMIAGMDERHAHVCGDVQRIVATAEGAFGEQRDASRLELERLELEHKLAAAEQTIATLRAQQQKYEATPAVTRRTVAAQAVPMFAKSGVEAAGSVDAGALDAALSGLSLEQRIAVKAQLARTGLLA